MSEYEINIDTQGTILDARIFGEFEAYNATAKLDGLAAKLTNWKIDIKSESQIRELIAKMNEEQEEE